MTENSDTITVDESELEALIDERVEERLEEERSKASRRQVLGSLAGIGGAGALGFLGGRAVMGAPSDASGTVYFEQIGDSNNPVSDLYVNQQTTLNNIESFTDVDISDTLEIPAYSSDGNAPNSTIFRNSSDGDLKFKDSGGTVTNLSGLVDGENFDGQGTSDFTNINSFNTESLVIGGTLYEEDDNSPFQPSNTGSATYSISGSYDEIIIIPERDTEGFDQFRINGKSGQDYTDVKLDATESGSNTEWSAGNNTRRLRSITISHGIEEDAVGIAYDWGIILSDDNVGGRYFGDTITSLDSFDVIQSDGSTDNSMNARVFGRVMNI